MCTPLLTTEPFVARSEKETERCITTLAKCFLTEDAKFKRLPSKLILHIARPLFCLYNKTRESPCILKRPLQQLLLKILENEAKREELYAAFLGHRTSAGFGDYVTSEFGPTGGIEIVGLCEDLSYMTLAETVRELVCIAKDLSPSVFVYVLSFLSDTNQVNQTKQCETIETEEDRVRHMEMQVAACVLLQQLADMSTVREAQAREPHSLLSFIKSLFTKYIDTSKQRDNMEESECELLYLSLMLIKTMIEEHGKLQIGLFQDFKAFLKERVKLRIPAHLKSLMNDVVSCIDDRSKRKYYQDMSLNATSKSSKFDDAIRDLFEPSIPVQANGLVTLRKLIESRDPCTMACKEIVLNKLKVCVLMSLERSQA